MSSQIKIPKPFIWATVGICIMPFLLNLIGIDFASTKRSFDLEAAKGHLQHQMVDSMFYTLSGSFTHTILEWSAFCAAIFAAALSFAHFNIKRDAAAPVIGVALLCAGCMDAFHTLAADRLIEATADNRNLIPFTWAICRLFNSIILIAGAGLLMLRGKKDTSPQFIIAVSMVFGIAAYGIIHYCATEAHLPETMYPDSIITRPWDVGPLALFVVAGVWVFPRFYKNEPSLFSHSLIISLIPQIATQLHMAFGSTALFDNHFNIAHFLKILAYVIPFAGLLLEYIRTYEAEAILKKELHEERNNLEIKISERTQKLQESEYQFRSLVDNIPGVSYRCLIDDDWTMVYISDAMKDLSGYPPSDFIRNAVRTFSSVIHPEDRKKVAEAVEGSVSGNTPFLLEYRLVHANGGILWVSEKGQVKFNANGKADYLDGAFFDITDSKNAETKLRHSEKMTRAIIENSMECIIRIDEKAVIRSFNPAAERTFGYRAAEVTGRNINMLMPEPYKSEHDEYMKTYSATGVKKIIGIAREVEAMRRDGSIFPIELSVSEIFLGEERFYNGMVRDITERKKAEEKLLKNNIFSELHKDIAVSANKNLPIEEGIQLVVNNVCEGLGWPVGHVYWPDPESPDKRLIPSKIWKIKNIEDCLPFIEATEETSFEKGSGLPGRVWAGGKPEWISISISDKNFSRASIAKQVGLRRGFAFPVFIGKEVVAVLEFFSNMDEELDSDLLIMMEDIGNLLGSLFERKRGEEQLKLAQQKAEQANKAKSLFISSMSHEIRTPMNAILGYSQILERDKELAGKHRKGVESIHRAGNHLLGIINDILDFSKIEAGKLELHPHDFDLGSLVQDLTVIFSGKCKEKNLDLKTEGIQQGQKIHVHAEAGKLRQVLINLIGNAVKFTDSGAVGLRVMPLSGDQFYFEVKDTGQGISQEKLKSIFESFQQDEEGIKKGGAGLGLAIAKSIISAMGGELQVESEFGQGSRFFFTLDLPAAKESVREKDDSISKAIGLAKGFSAKTVLIDDNKDNLEVLSGTLKEIGIKTFEAENGLDGLEMIRNNQPDMIFVDYHMPEMDGLEVTKQVINEFGENKIKIVMISASTFDHHREQYMKEGVHGFVGKPFLREEILGVMARLLGLKYEYEESPDEIEMADVENIDYSSIKISKELYESSIEMANLGMMTELEEMLPEIESCGSGGQQFSAYLKDLIDKFDTDGLMKALEKIDHE